MCIYKQEALVWFNVTWPSMIFCFALYMIYGHLFPSIDQFKTISLQRTPTGYMPHKLLVVQIFQRLYVFLLFSDAPYDVQLSQNSTSIVVEENKHVLINCSADCRPQCEYQWTGQFNWSSSNKHLVIRYVKKEDSGFYRCTAKNSIGYQYSSYILVTVHCKQ